MKYYYLLCIVMAFSLMSCEEDETTDGTGNSVNLSRDLVLQLTFEEGSSSGSTQIVSDNSGKGNNGVIEGSPEYITDTPNSKGYALKLRKGDYVNIPTFACKDSSNVTVSFCIKEFGQGMLLTSMNGERITTPSIYVNSSDKIAYQFDETFGYNWSTCVFSTSATTYQSAGWHHFTVTSARKLNTIKLYVDGTLIDTQSGEQKACSGTKMQIGGNADGEYNVSADPMLIDNIRVYRRCLSEKEVRELYKEEMK